MGESHPVFSKDDLLGQLNGLKNKYVNYSDYSNEKITDIFSDQELSDATVLKARTFATSYIENLGDGTFERTSLPTPAQFSPIYGILVQDFNSDGNLDVLLAGNFFGNRVKYGRYDANKGVLLLGDGKGTFREVDNVKSGLALNGEVRDITTIKSNGTEQLILFVRNDDGVLTYKTNSE